jgi:neutral ceramidase
MGKSRQDDPAGEEMNNALRRLWTGSTTKPPLKPNPLDEELSQSMVRSMGQIMAEEALDVMARTRHFESDVVIHAAESPLECPGRDRTNRGREGYPGTYKDGDPVKFRLGELRIGDVALGAIDGEVYNTIGQELKRESPFTNTIFVTLANGQANSGYIPTDDAFGRYTFQVLGTRLKPGCAERGIVDMIDGMIERELVPTPQ